jgi:hypothetical protein
MVTWVMALPALTAAATAELALPGYQAEGGAIALHRDGATVDPYFATKALLAAREAGLDARVAAARWIAWLLPRQRADGRFDRYCRRGAAYEACAEADADDAMLAVWMELLTSFAPPTGMPAAWARSAARAEAHLAKLRDPVTGVYRISEAMPVSLFMDNLEVHAAFVAMRDRHAGMGHVARARRWRARGARLQRDVVALFWDPAQGAFRVSTQAQPGRGFYPDEVAQIFPLASGFPLPEGSESAAYARWMAQSRSAWLRQGERDYPWGLITLASLRMGDGATVLCWRARAAPFRHGEHWNVLEEAVYLAVEARYGPVEVLAPACGP